MAVIVEAYGMHFHQILLQIVDSEWEFPLIECIVLLSEQVP